MAVACVTWPVSCTAVLPRSVKRSKQAPPRQPVNDRAIQPMDPRERRVEIQLVADAAVDERWSVVGKKAPQRWLWHAIDHRTGVVFA